MVKFHRVMRMIPYI